MEKQQKKKVKELEKLDKVKIGYARVSSQDDRQKLGLEVQTEALKNCDIIFSEKQSGDNDNRPELANAISLAKQLAKQDKIITLQIYKLDRLTRKMLTLANIIDELNQHNIKLISLQENIETDSLTGRLLCLVLGYVAEIELDNIRFRTKEGLRKAKENGVKLGNQGLPEKTEAKIVDLYQLNSLTVKEIAKRCKVSEMTVYNVARRNNLTRRNPVKLLQK
ncbi:recombinase family protein [Candidatus Enterococcus clewellii]|uniref:Resolvase/invertase-type recombinase catalytic domain-containing protein n=1 Tax=Candidatus Enterococcus clewellii TaxID=1834193 RepID=A0AAQ3Y1J3_9ENTE